jgi:hypothetical protein
MRICGSAPPTASRLPALSMRRLAGALGAGVMSLYHDVASKGLARNCHGPNCRTGSTPPRPRAATCTRCHLCSLNGLQVGEACGADVDDLAEDRWHHTLAIVGKGDKPVVIPLPPRTVAAIGQVVSRLSNARRTPSPVAQLAEAGDPPLRLGSPYKGTAHQRLWTSGPRSVITC